jgi:hypothetical protein
MTKDKDYAPHLRRTFVDRFDAEPLLLPHCYFKPTFTAGAKIGTKRCVAPRKPFAWPCRAGWRLSTPMRWSCEGVFA